MEVRYQISEDDFVAAFALCKRKQRRLFFGLQIIGGMILLSMLFLVLVGRTEGLSWPFLIYPTLLIGLPYWVAFQFRRTFRRSPVMSEPRTLTADENGIHFQSQSANGHVAWSNYVSFFEDKRSFALMQQGKQIFVPIPKRELTPAQISELSSLFETHIGRK